MTCAWCGTELSGPPNKKFCSPRCVNLERYHRDRQPGACQQCGEQLPPKHSKFCSKACQRRHRYETHHEQILQWHRDHYDPERNRTKHQRYQAIREATEEWRKPRPCAHCGAMFTPTPHRRKYCTPECSKAGGKPVYGTDEYRAAARAYYARPEVTERARQRRNAPRVQAQLQAYREQHRDEINAQQREQHRLKYQTDPAYRAKRRLSDERSKRQRAQTTFLSDVATLTEMLNEHTDADSGRGSSRIDDDG